MEVTGGKTGGAGEAGEEDQQQEALNKQDSGTENPQDGTQSKQSISRQENADGRPNGDTGKTQACAWLRCLGNEQSGDVQMEEESGASKPNAMSLKGKVIRTACAQAAYLGVTLNLGMIGPSMLDLEMLTHSTTQEMSTIFTWRAVLGLAASLLLGPVLDHVDRFLVVGLALAADVVLIAVAPWTTHIAALLATMAPPEFFNSAIGMGTHLICISIWGEKSGQSLQALNLMATIGYTLSPLLCKPFLAISDPYPSSESDDSLWSGNSSRHLEVDTGLKVSSVRGNSSGTDEPLYKIVGSFGPGANISHDEGTAETSIQYAYLIVALYDLLVAVAVLALFLVDGGKVRLAKVKEKEEADEAGAKRTRSKRFVVTICVLFFCFNIFYGGIEVGYAGLLMTFAVKHLGWSKHDGTNVTAVLQASNAIVTAAAILFSKLVRSQLLLLGSISVVTVAMVVLSVAAEASRVVLWVCTACLGVGYATIMPCSYTWVNEVMEVSGKFSSAYWAGFFTGFMVVPAVTGQLFYHVDPMWLPYAILICSLGMVLLFSIISLVVWRDDRAPPTGDQAHEAQPTAL